MEDLRKFFLSLDLKEAAKVGLLDSRHVVITLGNKADFHRIWARGIWYVYGTPMRVFKWSPAFHVDKEPSVVPVWFKLPKLPLHYFNKECLFQIVNVLGSPLFVDAATMAASRPSVARVCVEIDLLKPLTLRVWIGNGDHEGFWQALILENMPKYCSHCFRQGHTQNECHVLYPDLRTERPLISKRTEGNMKFQPRSSPVLGSVGDDQPGEGLDHNIIDKVDDSKEDEVDVVDKEGLSVDPKVKALDEECAADGDCPKICIDLSTEHATGACSVNQAVVHQPAHEELGDKILDKQIENLELLPGRNAVQPCSADEPDQCLEQQAVVPSRVDEGLTDGEFVSGGEDELDEDIPPRGVVDDLQVTSSSAVADIFNLDPIIQQVDVKLQHKEGFQVVSHGKQKGVRVQFKSDRSLRSKAKASSNSFSALSQ
ncbi:uncharacterized protein LOC113760210 [Coffea eugenioides]|uniref:uncharacterized protein LOC113760210 n=1 Tax=Coffea eugenioides TaxID=49369 RepID=UPI000F605E26|nr:uncharacterized protein LOC113760210 [Coffea eugenioides]